PRRRRDELTDPGAARHSSPAGVYTPSLWQCPPTGGSVWSDQSYIVLQVVNDAAGVFRFDAPHAAKLFKLFPTGRQKKG
ncbi:MAG: hypothetical protein KGZ88_14150, partial [Methylomicrobium sp.]|nr:hypothetical protein [Methylomicrobium sp.]